MGFDGTALGDLAGIGPRTTALTLLLILRGMNAASHFTQGAANGLTRGWRGHPALGPNTQQL